MSHTPTPWYSWLPKDCDGGCRTIRTEKGRSHGTYRGTEIASTFGLMDDSEDKANGDRIAATVNFFHSDDGRTVPTDKIPQGGFWEMIRMLERTERYVPPGQFRDEVRALLDRMGVK